MDAMIAEKVMGWRRIKSELNDQQFLVVPPTGNPHPKEWWWGKSVYSLVPKYSTDIAAAWEVLQKFNSDGLVVVVGSKRIRRTREGPQELLWYALIGMAKPIDEFDMNANILGEVEAPTAPLAICRTALRAIEARVQKNP